MVEAVAADATNKINIRGVALMSNRGRRIDGGGRAWWSSRMARSPKLKKAFWYRITTVMTIVNAKTAEGLAS
jgi:hypothetical protein